MPFGQPETRLFGGADDLFPGSEMPEDSDEATAFAGQVIDYRHPSPMFEDFLQGRKKSRRIFKMMENVPHKHQIEPAGGERSRKVPGKDDAHILETFFGSLILDELEKTGVFIHGENSAFFPDLPREKKGEIPSSRPDVGNGLPFPKAQEVKDLPCSLPRPGGLEIEHLCHPLRHIITPSVQGLSLPQRVGRNGGENRQEGKNPFSILPKENFPRRKGPSLAL